MINIDHMSLEEKFTIILDQYKNMILKVAGMYCREEEERKDLVQEIILHLWRAFPKYNDEYAVSTWLYRIALNVSISYVRKTATRNKAILEYKSNPGLIHIEDQDLKQRLTLLYDAIEFLQPFDKALIGLHLEGCKHKEIADVLGITQSNVSTRLSRIKDQLKSNFNSKNKSL
ncbi:MAG: sigma-70 family RNA polymerase sigma factor [Saprospiraceae bacterium]|nr:sigma-70 family RNA polymerase sigma factor [Saprospiraceae bacterium]